MGNNDTVKKANPKKEMLSVILSFRNEEDVIPELIQRLEAVLSKEELIYELIFVNDDSTDQSLDLLLKHAEQNSSIKIVNMSRRFGPMQCIIAGLAYSSGGAAVYMDSDLQDPPELLPELIGKWHDGADVVYTVRTRRQGETWLKMNLTRISYRLIGALSEIDLPEESGDFRLLSRRAIEQLLKIKETDPYLRGLTRLIGFNQEVVYYEREPRAGGVGHFPVLTNINPARTFFGAIASFSTLPIILMLLFGGTVSGLALVGLAFLSGLAVFGIPWPTTSMVVFLLFLWSSLIFAVGIVGLYASRASSDARERPLYIVQDTVGFSEINQSS